MGFLMNREQVMGFLMKSHKGEMDGTVAKNIAEEIFKVFFFITLTPRVE